MESLQERIAKRAYELFLARGGQHGYHIEDWAQAEKEIREGREHQEKLPKSKEPKEVREVKEKKTPVANKEESPARPAAATPAKKRVVRKKGE